MHQHQQMRDPAVGVPRELLAHLHLVSKYRYPSLNQMSLDTVVSYLSEAPKIVHDLQPVVWQFLEAPPDGTVLLVWQPLETLGTAFASDGYVWGDAEHAFNSEHKGYMVEMWLHRGGYHWPNEPYTAHCRKRYRLTQSKNPNAPPCDPSLWIVHYSRAERENVIPASQLPMQPQIQATLNQRRFLQSQGQLARKEFMLHDKANWPTINLPSAPGAQYPQHMMARQPTGAQMQTGASPMKNMPDRNQHRRGPSHVLESTLEEEEDVSRGDILDFMTPRDISRMRYEQHHEWMEEIMSSPFAMKQIVPTDLGLGRKGELEALTSGFFDTPTSVLQETSANARVGRMEKATAEQFTAKAAKKVAEMENELVQMRERHVWRMAEIEKASVLTLAERKLRTAGAGSGRRSSVVDGDPEFGQGNPPAVDDIVRDVETAVGKKVIPASAVNCIQRGGLEEKVPTPKASTINPDSPRANSGNEDPAATSNAEVSPPFDRAVSLDVLPREQPSGTEAPPMTPPAVQSDGHEMGKPTEEDVQLGQETVPTLDDMDVDIEMAGLGSDEQPVLEQSGENDGSEWVMVDNVNAGMASDPPSTAVEPPKAPLQQAIASPATAPGSNFANTPTGSGIQGLTPAETEGLQGGDFDLGQGEFEANMDDPGHGLVDFGDDHGDLNLEGMDDSAFGEAFHPPEENQGPLSEQGNLS